MWYVARVRWYRNSKTATRVCIILVLYAVFARLGLVDRRQRDESMETAIINSLPINTRASCEPLQLFLRITCQ
ncbi:hypothetical protein J3F84DRAFT_372223 [Trichoderma pleuroticola]